MATRNQPLALRDAEGLVFEDDNGAWLDPFSKEARAYIAELGKELAEMGFDELLLSHVAHPDAEVIYSRDMSGSFDRTTAVSQLALALTQELGDTQVRVSALMDAQAFQTGDTAVNGQSLAFFLKVFQRVYAPSDASRLADDRAAVSAAFEGADALIRFVPLLPGVPDDGSWLLQ
jgi:hypothetical protein